MEILNQVIKTALDRKRASEAERLIRLAEVLLRTGLSRSTIYLLMKSGAFPQNIRLRQDGRACGWIESEIDAWIAARIQAARYSQN